MSDYTSSEDDPFDDAINTLDPVPDISLLGTTAKECSSIAHSLTRFFQPQSPIPAFFVKASKHEGAVLMAAIDYRSIRTAHTRQATIIDKLWAKFKAAVSTIDNLKAEKAELRGRVTSSIHMNHVHTATIDKLKVEHTATFDKLKANLQATVTASFESNARTTALSCTLADITAANDRLRSELVILSMPTPTSSATTQTDPVATPPTTSTSAQTTHTTVDAASQTTPVSTPTTGDATTQTNFIATTNKPIPATYLPSVSQPTSHATQPTSYAQATMANARAAKANLSLSHALAAAHATAHATTATSPAPAITSPAFKGH
jgi:hypothetical protein